MKKWLFVDSEGRCSQSDDDAVMAQQTENDETVVINTETGTYQYGSDTPEPVPDQELFSPDDVDPEEDL
jgi:hypothetical protein